MERSTTWKEAKKNLDSRGWVRQEIVKGFADFVLNKNSEKEADQSFDNEEMCKYTFKQIEQEMDDISQQ